tara:strand:- start:231751 stop:232161 length:411 start_codon:yes stop_codon:yes gene_type:complete
MSGMPDIVVKESGSERVICVLADHLNHSDSIDSLSRLLGALFNTFESSSDSDDECVALCEEYFGETDGSEIDKLTLDFRQVGWLSSDGLNELISINRQARTRGLRLVLSNVQEPVREVFALTRLERMFELAEPQAK